MSEQAPHVSVSGHRHAHGVLTDPVIRDPASNGFLFGITLRVELDDSALQGWLHKLTELIVALEHGPEGHHRATATVGLGQPFFARGSLAERRPARFSNPPSLPGTADAFDVLIYVLAPREADVAGFELELSRTREAGLASVVVERGYQRRDHREHFGFRDGLRNVPHEQRETVVFIGPDRQPEEPMWAVGGSYMAYLKVRQNLEVMAGKPLEEQQAVIGRRKDDGSRLDLPAGSDPHTEPEIPSGALPSASHVQKVGPRGALRDTVKILRRGVPYLSMNADGSVDAGLQFISFQASLDDFDVILNRWMLNASFPSVGAGQDALVSNGAITFERSGVYIVPPGGGEFIGSALFQPDRQPPHTRHGRVAVRKTLLGPDGQPVAGDLSGAQFVLLDGSGAQLGDLFVTNPAGHAESPEVPVGITVKLHELTPLPDTAPAADQDVAVDRSRVIVRVTNTTPNPNQYGS